MSTMRGKHHPEKPKEKNKSGRQGNPIPLENISENKNQKIHLKLGLMVAAFAFLLYANTLNHQYVLDDYPIIADNSMTQNGIKALPDIFKTGYLSSYETSDNHSYRPVTKSIFAIEWQIAADNPSLGHWINVLLYSSTCFLLFMMLVIYMGSNMLIPFLSSLLFVAHPIHTEVVANIKSLDEILALFFFLLSAISVHRFMTDKRSIHLLLAMICFFLSLLSKESAITFLGVSALLIFFFVNGERQKKIMVVLALSAVAGVYIIIRHKILGTQMTNYSVSENYLFGIKDFVTQKATAVFLLGVYLKLLVFPHPLIADGSLKQFPEVHIKDWQFIVAAIILSALLIYAALTLRKKNIFSFSILFFFATAVVVSNIFFLFQTGYGERLMFSPSLGYCIFAGALIEKFTGRRKTDEIKNSITIFFKTNSKALMLIAVVVLLFSFKTVSRNRDWQNNFTLFSSDAVAASNSARIHYFYGSYLAKEKFLNSVRDADAKGKFIREAVSELKKAIDIYPRYPEAHQRLAEIYSDAGMLKDAEYYYKIAVECDSLNPVHLNNYGKILRDENKLDEAITKFETALRYDPNFVPALFNIATIYNYFGEQLLKNDTLRKANDSNLENYTAAMQNFKTTISYLQRAIKADPQQQPTYNFISDVYRKMGDQRNSEFYLNLYNEVKLKAASKHAQD